MEVISEVVKYSSVDTPILCKDELQTSLSACLSQFKGFNLSGSSIDDQVVFVEVGRNFGEVVHFYVVVELFQFEDALRPQLSRHITHIEMLFLGPDLLVIHNSKSL